MKERVANKWEQTKRLTSKKLIGYTAGRIIDRLYGTISEYKNEDLLLMVDEQVLGHGGSVLVVIPDISVPASINLPLMIRKFKHRNTSASGVLVAEKFGRRQMGLYSLFMEPITDYWQLEPLAVVRKQHVINTLKSGTENDPTNERAKEILQSPGGILGLAPEGGRTPKRMVEAQPGLSDFSEYADAVISCSILPKEFIGNRVHRYEIRIHTPIPGKRVLALCKEIYGDFAGARAYRDVVMTQIALDYPAETGRRGFYAPFAGLLNEYADGKIKLYDVEERRLQNFLYTYTEICNLPVTNQ